LAAEYAIQQTAKATKSLLSWGRGELRWTSGFASGAWLWKEGQYPGDPPGTRTRNQRIKRIRIARI